MADRDFLSEASALALGDLQASQAADPMYVPPVDSAAAPAEAAPSTEPAAPVVKEEAPVDPVTGTPAKEAVPAVVEVAATSPAKTWKVVHDGTEVELTESEAIELARKGFDYTKKTQTLAELRKETEAAKTRARDEVQAEFDAERVKIGQFLRDPQALRAQLNVLESAGFFEGVEPVATAAPTTAPSLTQDDVARIVREEQAKFAQSLQTTAEKTVNKMEFDRLQKEYEGKVNSAVEAAITANPILKTLTDPKKVFFADVHPWVRDRILADPDKEVGLDAVIGKINEVAAKYAQSFESTANERAKQLAGVKAQQVVAGAVASSQSLAQGVGAGGGVVTGGVPTTKGLRVGDSKLRALVMEDLNRAASAER